MAWCVSCCVLLTWFRPRTQLTDCSQRVDRGSLCSADTWFWPSTQRRGGREGCFVMTVHARLTFFFVLNLSPPSAVSPSENSWKMSGTPRLISLLFIHSTPARKTRKGATSPPRATDVSPVWVGLAAGGEKKKRLSARWKSRVKVKTAHRAAEIHLVEEDLGHTV